MEHRSNFSLSSLTRSTFACVGKFTSEKNPRAILEARGPGDTQIRGSLHLGGRLSLFSPVINRDPLSSAWLLLFVSGCFCSVTHYSGAFSACRAVISRGTLGPMDEVRYPVFRKAPFTPVGLSRTIASIKDAKLSIN